VKYHQWWVEEDTGRKAILEKALPVNLIEIFSM
jgi:hypothetical protein